MSEQLDTLKQFVPWTFERHGLKVYVQSALRRTSYEVNGNTIDIPEGVVVGNIHFMPNGRTVPDPKERTLALSEGAQGLGEFLAEYDRQAKQDPSQVPEFLIGVTNKGMAKFAQSMGFQFVDNIEGLRRYADSHIDIIGRYTIIGRVADVREKYEAKTKKSRVKALLARAKREARRSLSAAIPKDYLPRTLRQFPELAVEQYRISQRRPAFTIESSTMLATELGRRPGESLTGSPIALFGEKKRLEQRRPSNINELVAEELQRATNEIPIVYNTSSPITIYERRASDFSTLIDQISKETINETKLPNNIIEFKNYKESKERVEIKLYPQNAITV